MATRALSYRPDVVVIDIDGDEDGALGTSCELAARLPQCRTLFVADSATSGFLRRAPELRVAGLIGKNGPCGTLVDARVGPAAYEVLGAAGGHVPQPAGHRADVLGDGLVGEDDRPLQGP
ncbi:hypothetical protein [Streptomyces adelaidensis]|uniref:hypothetical protein n=1 Tax=Streptomyces adelaidensis TaxID=2796465 RepID=UPI001F258BBA|nr:hypothetical protein [Streptomyces adelaidensis]